MVSNSASPLKRAVVPFTFTESPKARLLVETIFVWKIAIPPVESET